VCKHEHNHASTEARGHTITLHRSKDARVSMNSRNLANKRARKHMARMRECTHASMQARTHAST
jgi:hypothetical protein